MSSACDAENPSLSDVLKMFENGLFRKMRIVALDEKGMILEFSFNRSDHQEACLLTT